jgi:RHS repeat-associated protein
VPTHDYEFDGLDRVVTAKIPSSEVRREYDSLGRLAREIRAGKIASLVYDDLAGSVDLIFPDGRRERTELDLLERPTRIWLVSTGNILDVPAGTDLLGISYTGSRRLGQIQLGNGVQETLVYDDSLRLVRVEYSLAGETIEEFRYRYDARNRRRVVMRHGPPEGTRVHAFDISDRVSELRERVDISFEGDPWLQSEHDADIAAADAAAAARWETFKLDPADSLLLRTRMNGASALSTSYTYLPGHRPNTVGTTALSHNGDGVRLTDGRQLYQVDALGRITGIKDLKTSEMLATFEYDALSRQITRSIGGSVFERWFAGGIWIHEESATEIKQRSIHPVWPIAFRDLSSTLVVYPLWDGALSSAASTNGTGVVLERLHYDGFGVPTVFSADGLSELPQAVSQLEPNFLGLSYQTAVKLYASGARLYDPTLALYLQSDPLLYQDSPSPYVLSRQDPVDIVDPNAALGMLATAAIGGLIGAAVGGVGTYLHNPNATWSDIGEGLLVGGTAGFLSGLTFGASAAYATGTLGMSAVASGTLAGTASGGVGSAISGGWYGGKQSYIQSGGDLLQTIQGTEKGAVTQMIPGLISGGAMGATGGYIWQELVTAGALPLGAKTLILEGTPSPLAPWSPASVRGAGALAAPAVIGSVADWTARQGLGELHLGRVPTSRDLAIDTGLALAAGFGGALMQRYVPDTPMNKYAADYDMARTPLFLEEFELRRWLRLQATRQYRRAKGVPNTFRFIHHERAFAGYPELWNNYDIMRPVLNEGAHMAVHEAQRTGAEGPSWENITTHGPSTPRFPGSLGLPPGTMPYGFSKK